MHPWSMQKLVTDFVLSSFSNSSQYSKMNFWSWGPDTNLRSWTLGRGLFFFQGIFVVSSLGQPKYLSLGNRGIYNAKTGCSPSNACLSAPCPFNSHCLQDWDTYKCKCLPGNRFNSTWNPLVYRRTTPSLRWSTVDPRNPRSTVDLLQTRRRIRSATTWDFREKISSLQLASTFRNFLIPLEKL